MNDAELLLALADGVMPKLGFKLQASVAEDGGKCVSLWNKNSRDIPPHLRMRIQVNVSSFAGKLTLELIKHFIERERISAFREEFDYADPAVLDQIEKWVNYDRKQQDLRPLRR